MVWCPFSRFLHKISYSFSSRLAFHYQQLRWFFYDLFCFLLMSDSRRENLYIREGIGEQVFIKFSSSFLSLSGEASKTRSAASNCKDALLFFSCFEKFQKIINSLNKLVLLWIFKTWGFLSDLLLFIFSKNKQLRLNDCFPLSNSLGFKAAKSLTF